jgi:hypothetical protein
MIELDGIYWFARNDKGISSIQETFSNLLDEVALPRLIRDYDTWSLDMHLCLLREGKAFGSSKARTGTRDSILLSRLKSSPNYQRNLETRRSQGKDAFNRLKEEARIELHGLLRRYWDAEISLADVRRDSADFFQHFYTKVWEAGRGASGLDLYMPEALPTRAEAEWLKSAIREELTFWQSFMTEVEKGEAQFADEMDPMDLTLRPPARNYTVEERIDMYLAGLEGIYENGRVSAMPSNLLFYWFGPKPGERGICKGCTYIVERQPFTKDTLPAVPRTGSTPCLMNCRHKLVVRQASAKEVANREAALPSRETMVKQLSSLKEHTPKYKVKGKLVNPWQKK